MAASSKPSYFILILINLILELNGNNQKPHIIFIIADDAGWNDFSFHGSAQIPTPNIDALAFSGVVLNSYYASPLCTPSRGAILTGKHPIHLGLQHYVIRGDTADGLPLSEKLLPEYLKDLGYSTHLVGKWHLGHFKQVYSPTFRGFDTHFGYWLGSQDYYDHSSTDAGHWGYDFRSGMNLNRSVFGKYNTDLITEESIRLIETHEGDEPIFLMISHTAPHAGNEYDPLQAPEENIEKFKAIEDENRRVYAAMVDKLDESVGEVIAALGGKGMLDNAIVIFASDNGGAPEGFNLNYGSNWPLRGVKNTYWEGGTRVAACVWSKHIQNRVSRDMMHASDWLPTLYEAAGGNLTNLGELDGVSIWQSLVEGKPSLRNELLYNIDDIYNNSAIRYMNWKLIQGNTSTNDLGGGIWDGWYANYPQNISVSDLIPGIVSSQVAKSIGNVMGRQLDPIAVEYLQNEAVVDCGEGVIECDPYNNPCLFDLNDDPCERRNLAEEEKEVVEELKRLIRRWNETAKEIIDLRHNPEADPKWWGYAWVNWKDFD